LVFGICFIAEGFAVRCEVSIREALSFVIPKRAAQRNLLVAGAVGSARLLRYGVVNKL